MVFPLVEALGDHGIFQAVVNCPTEDVCGLRFQLLPKVDVQIQILGARNKFRQRGEKMADIQKTVGLKGPLIYRHRLVTRVTHWIWAISLLLLLMSGLQIFNAHPTLYWGHQSGFEFDNAILKLRGVYDSADNLRGQTTLFGMTFDTTGYLGASEYGGNIVRRGFPPFVTAPSWQDLATGRIIHFFFAWIFVSVIAIWFLSSLAMSPGMDAGFPLLPEVFGGRQSARTIHFITMSLLVLFFIVHMIMVLAAGPINELRSIITGWYRKDPEPTVSGEAQ